MISKLDNPNSEPNFETNGYLILNGMYACEPLCERVYFGRRPEARRHLRFTTDQ